MGYTREVFVLQQVLKICGAFFEFESPPKIMNFKPKVAPIIQHSGVAYVVQRSLLLPYDTGEKGDSTAKSHRVRVRQPKKVRPKSDIVQKRISEVNLGTHLFHLNPLIRRDVPIPRIPPYPRDPTICWFLWTKLYQGTQPIPRYPSYPKGLCLSREIHPIPRDPIYSSGLLRSHGTKPILKKSPLSHKTQP